MIARPKLLGIFAIAAAMAGIIASILLWARSESKLWTGAQRVERQRSQLVALRSEHERLSGLIVPSRDCLDAAESETARLRAEAELLRQKTNQLWREPTAPVQIPNIPAPSRSASRELFGVEHVISDSPSEEYKQEVYKIGASSPHSGEFNITAFKDAQNLTESLRTFARAHEGAVPASFDEAAEHLFNDYRPPLSNDYEIVFQGSLNDITNIPSQAIALVRERQPWPTPSGNLGRIYGMANGFVRIVESDDNFHSWEAEHVIPPR